MATKARPRRSVLMWLLRPAAPLFLLAFLASGAATVVGSAAPADGSGWTPRDVGYHALVFSGLLLVVALWGGVYLEVREAARGMPGLRAADEPVPSGEAAGRLRATEKSLLALGFRPAGWFVLDDFARTHVGAWRHESRPAAAFVLYYPDGEMFRLRFVRQFPSGGVLVSSTRLCDLSYQPPQGVYLQMKKGASVEELWAWHLEAEALFPDAAEASEAPEPRELFVAVAARWAGHRRRDPTWLLAIEPVGECWRLYHLCGVPLARQFELGWTDPYWR